MVTKWELEGIVNQINKLFQELRKEIDQVKGELEELKKIKGAKGPQKESKTT